MTPNHQYSSMFLEPWEERTQRGYGLEVLERFFEEVAYIEFGGPTGARSARLEQMRSLTYDDLTADRNTVAVVQALEAILANLAAGKGGAIVEVNVPEGGLVLRRAGSSDSQILYAQPV
jgi:hypothetical protein